MIILMGIALTILCICSVMELALILFMLIKNSDVLLKNKTAQTVISHSEPAPDAIDEETMKRARKRYEEELLAFQDLLNYNADVAYGVDKLNEE